MRCVEREERKNRGEMERGRKAKKRKEKRHRYGRKEIGDNVQRKGEEE